MTVGELTSELWNRFDRAGGKPKELKLFVQKVQRFSLGTPIENAETADEALTQGFNAAEMRDGVVVLLKE